VGECVRGIGSSSWDSGVLVRVNLLLRLNSGTVLYVNTVRNGTVRYRYNDKAGCGRYVLGEVGHNCIARVAIRYRYGTEQYDVEWAVCGRMVRAVPVRSSYYGRGLRPAQISWSNVIPLLFDVQ
jgi:hypothetical protein